MITRAHIRLAVALILFFPLTLKAAHSSATPREWNFLVYMANNNNLNRYGVTNFRQMVHVGSNTNVNLLLQMDTLGQKEASRFYLGKDNPVLLETHTNSQISYSGTPANLIDFTQWGASNFPAEKTCLVLWNHGAGIKDPSIWGRALDHWRDHLFFLNTQTGIIELDRSQQKRDEIKQREEKGIAFNDAASAYLTNEDLKASLEFTCQTILGGKKIDVLAMDACHMAMIEVASQLKTAVNVMIASEEVEPGAGYNYIPALAIFGQSGIDPYTVGKHIVGAYHAEYRSTLGDYTQSAVDLSYCDAMEANLSQLANGLLGLMHIEPRTGFTMLREIRFNRSLTTEFYDSDYIDLGHFYKSLIARAQGFLNTGKLNFGFSFGFGSNTHKQFVDSWRAISDTALEGLRILQVMVIANAAGRNLKNATGLSIYFPITTIHSSYARTEFARNTTWPLFIDTFIHMRFGGKTLTKEITHATNGCCASASKPAPCTKQPQAPHKLHSLLTRVLKA